MRGRTIAIGDIHGCNAALSKLLEEIVPTTEDTIVTLGDYIDRGPNSFDVIEQLLDLEKKCELVPLMGNHELMLRFALQDPAHISWWRDCGGLATLVSYHENVGAAKIIEENFADAMDTQEVDSEVETSEVGVATGAPQIPGPEIVPQEHLDFFESCALAYETDTHIFVHANYDADTPMDEQEESVLLWQHLSKPPSQHVSGKRVVVGHTPQLNGEVLDLGYLVCIDTYCFGTGWLTAMDVESGQIWQANRHGELRTES